MTSVVAAAEVARKVYEAVVRAVKAGRKSIAKRELEEETDIDGDGVIGGVGNRRKRLQRPAGR